jgi:hypothetical protein
MELWLCAVLVGPRLAMTLKIASTMLRGRSASDGAHAVLLLCCSCAAGHLLL